MRCQYCPQSRPVKWVLTFKIGEYKQLVCEECCNVFASFYYKTVSKEEYKEKVLENENKKTS